MPGYIKQNELVKLPFLLLFIFIQHLEGKLADFPSSKILQPEKFLCCCNKTKELLRNTIPKIKMVPDRCLWLCPLEFWIMLVV